VTVVTAATASGAAAKGVRSQDVGGAIVNSTSSAPPSNPAVSTDGDSLVMAGLGALAALVLGGALGLVLGTLVTPNRINIVFSLVFTPLLFTGCSQYPWPSLDRLRWFQVVTALNPMTYVSEGMRAALVPDVPHIAAWVCVLVIVGSLAALSVFGVRGFYRRAID
jgi:ABC-2 type transport system permease protein